MRHLKPWLLTLLFITLGTASAIADPHIGDGQCRRYSGGEQQFERLSKALALTPEQQTEIRAILAESRTDMTARQDEAKANRAAIRSMLAATTLEEPKLRDLLHKQSELQADRIIARQGVRSRIEQILTPEQQAKWDELRQQRQERRERRGKPRHWS